METLKSLKSKLSLPDDVQIINFSDVNIFDKKEFDSKKFESLKSRWQVIKKPYYKHPY